MRILNEKVKTPKTTIYRCGPLIDLCRGPHIRHTGKVKAFKVIKVNINICFIFKLKHTDLVNMFFLVYHRILQLTGKEIVRQKHCNECMVLHFRIINLWKNGRSSKKKPQKETIVELEKSVPSLNWNKNDKNYTLKLNFSFRNKNCFSSMN